MFVLKGRRTTTAGNKYSKSDITGALASGLCLIHCLATPFIFAVHAGLADHHDHHGHGSPFWWGLIDSVFLIISFFAVLWSARKTTRTWMKILLFASWGILLGVVLNEKMGWMHIPEEAIYFPALSLIILHLYNQRYCQCADDQCCVETPFQTETT